MELDKQIQEYIAGQLSTEERADLESAILADPAVRSEYESHLALHRGIAQQERSLLKTNLEQVRRRQLQRRTWLILGIAVLLVLLGGLLYSWWNAKTPEPSQYLAEAYPNVVHPVTRTNPTESYNQAFWYYEAAQYTEAAQQFALLLESNQDDALQFYYAMSLFNSQQYALARPTLEALESAGTTEFLPEVRWYLALVYYQNNNLEQAKAVLQRLQASGAAFKQEEARLLLEAWK